MYWVESKVHHISVVFHHCTKPSKNNIYLVVFPVVCSTNNTVTSLFQTQSITSDCLLPSFIMFMDVPGIIKFFSSSLVSWFQKRAVPVVSSLCTFQSLTHPLQLAVILGLGSPSHLDPYLLGQGALSRGGYWNIE